MKRYILALLLLPSVAMADNSECPICTCTLIQRDPLWKQCHDEIWWPQWRRVQYAQHEYIACVHVVNAFLATLGAQPITGNQTIIDYHKTVMHPVEDNANNTEFCLADAAAATVTEGQFLGELNNCTLYAQQLQAQIIARFAQPKKRRR